MTATTLELESAYIIQFGVECAKSIQDKGMEEVSYKDTTMYRSYDNGWRREAGIFLSTGSNPVRFGTNWESEATHVKWVNSSFELRDTEWIPLDDNLRDRLRSAAVHFFRAKGMFAAEKWTARNSFLEEPGEIPSGFEVINLSVGCDVQKS